MSILILNNEYLRGTLKEIGYTPVIHYTGKSSSRLMLQTGADWLEGHTNGIGFYYFQHSVGNTKCIRDHNHLIYLIDLWVMYKDYQMIQSIYQELATCK